MAEDGGGAKKLVAGCLVVLVGAGIMGVFLIIALMGGTEETGMEMSGQESEGQTDLALLTDEGENSGKQYYEDHEEWINNTLIELAGTFDVHWVFLEAIYQQEVPTTSGQDCEDKWVGRMKLRELDWIGRQFLTDYPGAKTIFTDCGDLSDELRDKITDVETIEQYAANQIEIEQCQEEQESQSKNLFCRGYGLNGDDDEKADPESEKDAILTAAHLLSRYGQRHGNLGQAINHLYGENKTFVRKVKNQILDWLKDPSGDGVFRWPLDASSTIENKQVTNQHEHNFTIKSKEGETVYAVGTGYVEEVGHRSGCGSFVKLTHYLENGGGNLTTTYCHVKDIRDKVKKGENIQIGQELGEVGTGSLVIHMHQVDNNEDPNDNPEDPNEDPVVNPEAYLTAPNDVSYVTGE